MPRPLLTALCALLPWWFTGCARPAPPAAAESPAAPPGQATTVRPLRQTVRRLVELPAQNVEAFQQAPLAARVAGYVGKLHVDIGDRVQAGQVLIELTAPELEAERRQKEALVTRAEAELRLAVKGQAAAEAAVTSAEAGVRQAEAGRARARAEGTRAQSQFDRLTRAGGAGVIDAESAAESRYAHEAAQAGVTEAASRVRSAEAAKAEAEAKRDRSAAEVEAARAQVLVATAHSDHARAMCDYTRLRAPFAGRVTKRHVDVGHFVQPAGAGKGETLLTVERTDRLRVRVAVPELDALLIRHGEGKGVPVRLRGEALGGRVVRGALARSSFALDPRTRTLQVEIDVDNAAGLLRPGMYVHAAIELTAENAWTLPATALQRRDGAVRCQVVADGKAMPLELIVGLEGDGRVEVLQKRRGDDWVPLSGDEEVVAAP